MKSHSLLSKSAVYPRWRGEHVLPSYPAGAAAGLSPLARGTLDQAVLFFQRRRFIPAGAGNTQKQNTETAVPAVYPRWRGEHGRDVYQRHGNAGLSPLARGTLFPGVYRWGIRRFIPAGAGNTITFIASEVQPPVYPRWRGEHVTMLQPVSDNIGLSPLARGTLCSPRRAMKRIRFIPAGAGNTLNITYY